MRSFLIVLLFLVSRADAALIEVDLFSAGDGLATLDTSSNLEWLDLTETTGLSYNEIESDVGGWLSMGFRHATGSEVCGLYSSYGEVPSPCPTLDNSYIAAPASIEQVDLFLDHLGATGSTYGLGMFDDSLNDSRAGQGYFERVSVVDGPLFIVRQNVYGLDETQHSDVGHFLIRQVPEPGAITLLGMGLIGIAAYARRFGRAPGPG